MCRNAGPKNRFLLTFRLVRAAVSSPSPSSSCLIPPAFPESLHLSSQLTAKPSSSSTTGPSQSVSKLAIKIHGSKANASRHKALWVRAWRIQEFERGGGAGGETRLSG
ncbi:hypothetical protein K432DRAFT_168998 [Lepidopterella palustris CBS 459.81]|uniref:Uncharacterized protein n=1 Tax=Lepidopterella palustris CBS 459.81 TaxID=1314670 RepID=A0A8E2JKS8_9PEZI|nr:hypothetical protein K432DRAFT_168998 [Lepidopterella palustris CBS 459.81]